MPLSWVGSLIRDSSNRLVAFGRMGTLAFTLQKMLSTESPAAPCKKHWTECSPTKALQLLLLSWGLKFVLIDLPLDHSHYTIVLKILIVPGRLWILCSGPAVPSSSPESLYSGGSEPSSLTSQTETWLPLRCSVRRVEASLESKHFLFTLSKSFVLP